MIDLEEKVRQEMVKAQAARRPVSVRSGFSSGGKGG